MLALTPATALTQQTPPTSNTSAADAVGPSALQNFSLGGTVTKTAEPAPQQNAITARRPATIPPTTQSSVAEEPRVATPEQARKQVASTAPLGRPKPQPADPQRAAAQPASESSDKAGAVPALATRASVPAPVSTTFPPDPQTPAVPGGHSVPLIPWLLAAILLAGGGAFLFWRNRSSEAFAGGPQVDSFVAPQPAPPARPAPAPPEAAAPRAPAGVVSTRLRPWVEIGFQPLRCILGDEKVSLEFDLELFNSGSAPARAVLAEASLLNAGAQQEQEIGRFFAEPVGKGDRIPVIPPLQRFALKTQVSMARELLVPYEIGGRQVFVPVIAFNVLYDRSGAEGQTSAAYLLGRDTKGEKLGPFRLDLGPHIFRGVAARLLPDGVRQ
ncbi:MAG TPA: hypothetical protein VFW39_06380 [Sphingomicrobium sp.]|nr:hypothetical protein [Sphingomicrobium sp.]